MEESGGFTLPQLAAWLSFWFLKLYCDDNDGNDNNITITAWKEQTPSGSDASPLITGDAADKEGHSATESVRDSLVNPRPPLGKHDLAATKRRSYKKKQKQNKKNRKKNRREDISLVCPFQAYPGRQHLCMLSIAL